MTRPGPRERARSGPPRHARAGGGTARLFFAVFVPEEHRAALATAQDKLAGRYWKRVPDAYFHVTLLFLGGTPEGELDRVKRAARDAAHEVNAFDARLRGTGFFPNEGSPRVWFVKAEGDGFEPLAAALRARLNPGEDEPFKAHVTLARKKGPSPRPGPLVLNLPFHVENFALVRSILKPAGPTYQILERFTLQPAPKPQVPVEES